MSLLPTTTYDTVRLVILPWPAYLEIWHGVRDPVDDLSDLLLADDGEDDDQDDDEEPDQDKEPDA